MGSEFLRIKRILDQIHETEEEKRMICEVLRIKGILDNGGYKSECVLGVLLLKLKQMVVSMKVLEVSMIGTSVSSLMSHASKDVRRTASMLVRAWRQMADEWVVVNDNMHGVQEKECVGSNKKALIKPSVLTTRATMTSGHKVEVRKRKEKESKLQRKKRLNMIVMEKRSMAVDRRKPCASVETMKVQQPTKSVVPFMSLDKKSVEEKLEAAKRKFQESYKEAMDNKRRRRIQVIDVPDMLRLGLAPKHEESRFGKHISHRVGFVR